MKPFRRILTVVDPTNEAQPALERSVMLSRLFRADIELYASCYHSTLTDIATSEHGAAVRDHSEATVSAVRQRLETLAASIRSPASSVSCRAEWHKSRHGSIVAEAKRIQADLVVKDTHYHTAISRALFTNTDWSLIRELQVPLWLVRTGTALAEKPRIIAAVDLAEATGASDGMDESILEAGKELTRALHGTLCVFHAFDPMPVVGSAATWAMKPERVPVEKLRAELMESRTEALSALAGRHGVSPSCRLLKSGSVVATLPGTALEIGAGLVIMAAHTGRGAAHATIGSTAENVMDHVPCDLLVLKPGTTEADAAAASHG